MKASILETILAWTLVLKRIWHIDHFLPCAASWCQWGVCQVYLRYRVSRVRSDELSEWQFSVCPESRAPLPQQLVAQPLTKLLMFCKECANCRNESKCGQKTLLVLRTSDGTNLVKLVKCPKGGGRCSTENQFQAWVSSGLFGNSPIWGPALNCVSGRDC